MIIVKLTGGLGNQLFQYACGRAIALRCRTRLGLDTTWFSGQSKRVFELDKLHIEAAIATDVDIALVRHGNPTLRGRLCRRLRNCLPYYWRHTVDERGLAFDANITKVLDTTYLRGYWPSEEYFRHIGAYLRNELTPRIPLGDECESYVDRIRQLAAVSVHVRRGDYVSETRASSVFGALPLQYYSDAIGRIATVVPDAFFWVFSDDIAWARDNLHIPFPHGYVSVSSPVTPVMDLFLMSQCKHHVVANSTFSWWGAWLSSNPGKVVIAPARWYADDSHAEQAKDLVPGEWIRL